MIRAVNCDLSRGRAQNVRLVPYILAPIDASTPFFLHASVFSAGMVCPNSFFFLLLSQSVSFSSSLEFVVGVLGFGLHVVVGGVGIQGVSGNEYWVGGGLPSGVCVWREILTSPAPARATY